MTKINLKNLKIEAKNEIKESQNLKKEFPVSGFIQK